MSETRLLLGKIQALRQRLEQAQGLANEARSAAAALLEENSGIGGRLHALDRLVTAGGEHDLQMDRVLRPLTGAHGGDEPAAMPRQLTARARRVLERGRDLLGRLRVLADAFEQTDASRVPSLPALEKSDPLALLYRETAALTDTALRLIAVFPDTTTGQLHLCEGIEAILNVVATRLLTLSAGVERHRKESQCIARLAELLSALAAGQPVEKKAFLELAEVVLADAQDCGSLRFQEGDAQRPAHFIACHSLTTARVIARVIRHDPQLRGQPLDAVLAALLHDVGMLQVPVEILAQPGALNDDQRRAIEGHCHAGLTLVKPYLADAPWLAEAVGGHHERLDGSGYPGGLRDTQIKPLTRLLAVCDVYASLCTRRPHRPARETRTALTDTLLLADQGLLDRNHAECLLQLSFYPIGSVVELADGAVGVVVATPALRRDLSSPARPVVALLTDGQGQPLPLPHHLDLAQCDGPSIVRTLTAVESRDLLGGRFPEWV
jgi:hypothetical protein